MRSSLPFRILRASTMRQATPRTTHRRKRMGAKNVVVTSKKIGKIPSARVTASMNGQRVYMLYLAVPNADSPAILINYHPAGNGAPSDDMAWQHFIDSIEAR